MFNPPIDSPRGAAGRAADCIRRWFGHAFSTPRRIAGTLFVASLALRAAFALEMADTPLFRHQESVDTDNHFFTEWAGQIAGGDWMGRSPLHPYYPWNASIARAWARGQGLPFTEAVGRRRWNDWYGGARFHQEPLYPYFLAVVRAVTGDVRWAMVLQGLAGALTTALLFAIGRRLGGTTVGLVAAGSHLAYGPMLYYDFMLHRTSLQSFGGVLTVLCIMRARETGRLRDYAVLGVVLGLSMLLTSTAGPALAVVALVVLATTWGRGWRAEGVRLALLMTGMAMLVIAPAVLRNVTLGVPPLELSSVGAITFIDANASDVDPGGGFLLSQHSIDIMTETQGNFVESAAAAIITHVGVGWPVMVAQKLAYFFTPVEIPNNDSYAYYASYSSILAGPLIGFGLFGSLFAMGLWSGFSRRDLAWPVLMQVGLGLAVTLAFYDLSRFRAPIIAAAFPLMGLALVDVVDAWRRRHAGRLLVLAGLAAAPWIALRLAPPLVALPIRAFDVVEAATLWKAIITDTTDPRRALAIAERALDDGPDLDALLASDSPWTQSEVARVASDISQIERGAAASSRALSRSPIRHEVRAARLEALAVSRGKRH